MLGNQHEGNKYLVMQGGWEQVKGGEWGSGLQQVCGSKLQELLGTDVAWRCYSQALGSF